MKKTYKINYVDSTLMTTRIEANSFQEAERIFDSGEFEIDESTVIQMPRTIKTIIIEEAKTK